MKSINDRVRELLTEEDRCNPGFQTRANRVAVYAVATGQQLGFDADRLVALRLAAELSGIDHIDSDIQALMASDETSISIVRLSQSFDARRSGYGGAEQLSDSDCADWLRTEAGKEYRLDLVDALSAVNNLIQPIGS